MCLSLKYMKKLKLYNTMSREKEDFNPLFEGKVGLYTCGPTVYNYAHIGNLRAFIFEDILKRVLEYNGYKVKHIMNITDVGHLVGDGDMGEDKLERGAKREGKTAWDVAKYFEKAFIDDLKQLNVIMPTKWTRATEYIEEQIALIKILEEKGYTYKISDGIYYDTARFPEYNKLSHLDLETLQEGARVERNEEKRNPTDFALWKFSPKDAQRDMEWESPWGVGFPGWHVECSAMSRAELGEQLDIHCGGIDHINVHHTNEIAQSEAAYPDQKFFNYWMHNAFLNIEGGKKMAKSDDNFLTLENSFTKKGMSPLVYRFATLQTHYRKPMEYSAEGMLNSEKSYEHLKNQFKEVSGNKVVEANPEFKERFLAAINDDLNTPQALAVVQEVFKSDLSNEEKFSTIVDFNKVLGLDFLFFETKAFDDNTSSTISIDSDVDEADMKELYDLAAKRLQAREEKNWEESDIVRDKIQAKGYIVEDGKDGMKIFQKK